MTRQALIIAIVFAGAGPADADPSPDLAEARTYYDAGKQAYEAGQFRDAANAFEQAYALAPRPSTVFSLAQALRRQYFVDHQPRDLKRALDLFKAYLRDFPDGDRRGHAVEHIADLEPLWDRLQVTLDLEARTAADQPAAQTTQLMVYSRTPGARAAIGARPLRAVPVTETVEPGVHPVRVEAPGHHAETVEALAVEARIIVLPVELRAKAAALTVTGPGGARLVVDGQLRGRLPLGGPVEVAAGARLVQVLRRGDRPYTASLRLGNGERRRLHVRLQPTRQRRTSHYVMAGSGGLLLAGGLSAGVAWWAQHEARSITDAGRAEMRALTPDERDQHTRLLDRRNRFRTGAYALTGGALVAAGVGALLYYLDDPEPEQPRPGVTITPGPAPIGAGLSSSF